MTDELMIEGPDGTALAARRTGAGQPLVLVHGATGSKDSFAMAVPLLAEQHAVWTYDRRGRGASGDQASYALQREVEDLEAVLGAAGPGVHLVGHSFGAVCALEVAARGADLRSLVLYEPPVHAGEIQSGTADAMALLREGELELGLAAFLRGVDVSEEELEMVRSLPGVWDRLLDGSRSLAREVEAVDALGWQADRYRSIDVPTLLLTGGLTETPMYLTLDELRTAVPGAEGAELPGQRHLAFAFDPQGFAAAVLSHTTAHG